jgi:hypothetical protein
VEGLESRALLTLTVTEPLDLTQFAPFAGTVATFGQNDITNPLTATATISWGGTGTTMATIAAASNNTYDVVTAPETLSTIDPSLPVTVTVVGSTATLTAVGTADVSESPLTPTTDTFSATAGEAFSGAVGSFLDADPVSSSSAFTATINWGDNQDSTGVITPVGTSTPQRYEVSGVHTYASPGSYNASITVQRVAGGSAQPSTPASIVVNPPIEALNASSFVATANLAFSATVATFTASNASDVAGNFSATVKWGDGTTPTSATVSPITGSPGEFAVIAGHTYGAAGNYPSTVTVNLNAAPALSQMAIGNINVAPGASASPSPSAAAAPLTAAAGVKFTGVLGTFIDQADTNANDYSATFTTPSTSQTSATGLTIVPDGNGLFQVNGSVTFNVVGTYSDKLTITPPQGAATFSGSNTVTVIPAQYSGVGTPVTATVGIPLSNVMVATFADNTPNVTAAGYTATINWGTGLATTQGTIVPDPAGAGMFDVEGSFTYPAAGSGIATVTITRSVDSKSLVLSTPVTINPVNLVVSAVPPLALTADLAFSNLTVATFTDNTNDPIGDYTASITWGNGSAAIPATIVADPNNPGQFDVKGAFIYPAPGNFNVSVSVSRTFPITQTATISTPVTVAASAFSATGLSVQATAGVPLMNVPVADFTDAPDATASDYTATILWGSGLATTQGTITGSNGNFVVSGNFTYTTPGTNIATVTITRATDNKMVSASAAVTVANAFTATGVSVQATAGVPLNNVTVANFTDAPGTTASNYTATILWGSGLATTQGTITGSNGNFVVSGNFTYTAPGTNIATVTITRVTDSKMVTASAAVTVANAFTATGVSVQATAGVPVTNVPVADFTDAPGTTASNYTATILWGSGLATTQGTITGSNGNFVVSGNFTYTAPGTNIATVTITRVTDSKMVSASAAVAVANAFTATGVSVQATAGVPLTNVTVANFTDAPGTTASNYTASILWGSGLATTQGTITGSNGNFVVSGNFTYTTAGSNVVTVTITRVTDSKTVTATAAALVSGQLNLVPSQALTSTAGQQFSGTVATLVDAQGGKASDFIASIDWGDGSASQGSIVTVTPPGTGATPYLAVIGTHTYGQPYTYSIVVTVTRVASGQTVKTAVPLQVFGFTATVSGTIAGPSANGTILTNQQEPTLSGMAQPGATIALTFRRVGGGDPVPLGETQANSNGAWSLVVGPLGGQPIHVFAVVTPPNGPPTQSMVLFGGSALYVWQHPVKFINAAYASVRDAVKITIARADSSGPDPAGLAQPASYTLIGPNGKTSTPIAVSVAPLNPQRPRAHRTVTLKFAPSDFSRRRDMTLAVSFTGVANAGGSASLRLGRG